MANAMTAARNRGDRAAMRSLRIASRGVPTRDPDDPGYRRLRYSRYADDHLLGFTGPKAEAEQIRDTLAAFLREELKLELSAAKTLITHGRTQKARFLGYDIIVQHSPLPAPRQRAHRAAGSKRRGHGQASPLPAPRHPVAPAAPAEPGRPPDHQHLRRGIPGHRPVLPARRECLPAAPAAAGRRAVHAQDARREAPLHGGENGPQVQGRDRHPARAPDLLRGPAGTAGQETTGRTVRRHPAQTASQSGPHRPPARTPSAPEGGHYPAPARRMRMVPAPAHRWKPTRSARSPTSPASQAASSPPGRAQMAKMRRKTLIVCARCHQAIHHGKPAANCT